MPKANHPGESSTSQRRLEAAERQRQALEYRKMGATYEQIAQAVGFRSPQAAFAAIKAALTKMLREPTEKVRELELARLDQMMMVPYQRAVAGDLNAIATVLALMNRRAALLGVDLGRASGPPGPGADTPPAVTALIEVAFVSPAPAEPAPPPAG